MPKLCPACQRPNGDQAPKCLYCSEPLPTEPAPEAVALSSNGPAPISLARPQEEELAGEQRYLMILVPSGERSSEQASAFVEATGVSLYDANLLLAAMRPRLFRRLEGETQARELSYFLSSAGIAHYVVAEKEVRDMPVSRAKRGEVHARHLELSVDGADMALPYSELLLLVRGEITRERYHQKRWGTRKKVSRPLSPGLRLHLYTRHASVAVEVDADTFDWALLGTKQTPSAFLNLERFLGLLGEQATHVELDTGFGLEPVVLSRAELDTDLDDKLAESDRGGDGVLHDNETSFRFYARWRYRLARHLLRASGT